LGGGSRRSGGRKEGLNCEKSSLREGEIVFGKASPARPTRGNGWGKGNFLKKGERREKEKKTRTLSGEVPKGYG